MVQVKRFWMTTSGCRKKFREQFLLKQNRQKYASLEPLIGLVVLVVGKFWSKYYN